jgi:hypothetical protein|tara:strand:+ start:546 stop:716 length:171 start_codon:yes stop_codon:yes gene_type:complete
LAAHHHLILLFFGVKRTPRDLGLVHGEKPEELRPFGFGCYADGTTFGDRNSNCPWV